MNVGLWPGPGFPGGRSKLTLAGRAIAPKVRFLVPPRTHTGGQKLKVATGSLVAGQRVDLVAAAIAN